MPQQSRLLVDAEPEAQVVNDTEFHLDHAPIFKTWLNNRPTL